ncbi:hypothetical protein IJJ12_03290, partial [bacterium]|nr:hypothetical protein [bacterium]
MPRLIVAHQVPDLDAIGAIWLLQRFDNQHYGGSKVAFVPAGQTIAPETAAQLGFAMADVTHVDTGRGEFDHHTPEKAGPQYSACSLVYAYLLRVHPEYTSDTALKLMVEHITDVDHFGEAFWPDANHPRYEFMLHQIIDAMDATATNDDSYQVELGGRLLDFVYASMKKHVQAAEKLGEGIVFTLANGQSAFAIETGSEAVLPVAQKAGYMLVIKKDSKTGHARIKARPDAPFILDKLYQAVIERDHTGDWFYHPGGHMLL